MWMVDSNDHSKELKMPTDPVCGRKLRPLMPRPISSCTSKNSPYSTPSCCCIRNPNILHWNHPICGISDYGVKRELQTAPPTLVSTRWNPTPEQLQALEEMYRRGIRTPSAEQIQQIAAKLRRFGKIEGKNVFYWFQNHKARERQKKRRQLELLAGKKMHHADPTLEIKETGLSRRCIEIEHQKLPTLSNSSPPPEESASMAAAVIGEWPQLHRKVLTAAKNETCWQLHFSSSLSPYSCSRKATAPENTNLMPTMKENQTLELFPIGSVGLTSVDNEEDVETKFRPIEFIEFLPTKK